MVYSDLVLQTLKYCITESYQLKSENQIFVVTSQKLIDNNREAFYWFQWAATKTP